MPDQLPVWTKVHPDQMKAAKPIIERALEDLKRHLHVENCSHVVLQAALQTTGRVRIIAKGIRAARARGQHGLPYARGEYGITACRPEEVHQFAALSCSVAWTGCLLWEDIAAALLYCAQQRTHIRQTELLGTRSKTNQMPARETRRPRPRRHWCDPTPPLSILANSAINAR